MSQVIKNLAAGPVPPTVATQYTENSGIAIPDENNLNVLGGTGIRTVGDGASTITINVIRGGFSWVESSVNFSINTQEGAFCTAALTVSLPATATPLITGDQVIIYADTAAAVVIQANTGQDIEIGGAITSAPGGTATSTAEGCIVHLVYRSADSTWHALSTVGIWTTS